MKKNRLFIVIIVVVLTMSVVAGCGVKDEAYKFGGKLQIQNDSELKILMLTDIHITAGAYKTVEELRANGIKFGPTSNITGYQRDIWALQTVTDLVTEASPDFIVVTGDMVYVGAESQLFNPLGHTDNLKALKVFAEHMESFKIPWAAVFGNHDHEGDYSREDIADYLMSLKYCVFEKGPSEIHGFGNYAINVLNSDGTHNIALIMMDSNSYRDETKALSGYDSIHDDQIEWYEQKLEDIKTEYKLDELPQSLLFFHIPVKETKTVKELYVKGTNDSEFIFFEGVFGEEPHIPKIGKYNEVYYDGGNIFAKVVELASTKAIFVGHDHINNFIAKYQDVLMVNGKSIDYIAYVAPDICKSDANRGGTLITLKDKSQFVYDGQNNKPVEFIPYSGGHYDSYISGTSDAN